MFIQRGLLERRKMNKKLWINICFSVACFYAGIILMACDRQAMKLHAVDDEAGLETVSSQQNSMEADVGVDIGSDDDSYIDSDNSLYGSSDKKSLIVVYVTGQVHTPGVYNLGQDARIYEAIELAGGFTRKACKISMNLAERVVDGQHIHVLSNEEYANINNNETAIIDEASSDSLININTANKEELMQLPGIGEAKANAIITFRENSGDFNTIEEIMQVPGIKEGAFAKIKLLIKVK